MFYDHTTLGFSVEKLILHVPGHLGVETPGDAGTSRALDDEELFVVEGSANKCLRDAVKLGKKHPKHPLCTLLHRPTL